MIDDAEKIVEETGSKPHETGGVEISTFIKITDPETQEVLLEMRGDH